MRVIILGGTGYLGKKLVTELVSGGNKVTCVIRDSVDASGSDLYNGEVLFCHISQLDTLSESENQYDCMINAACKYPRNSISDTEVFEANFYNPLRVFLFALSHNVRRFITIGTGLPDSFNSYTFSKAKFAETMKWYGARYHDMNDPLQICNIKLENFYGNDEPKDRFIPGTVDKLKRNEKILLTEGTQIRDFIHIEDVVCSLMGIVNSREIPEYADIPLGSGEGVSIRVLVEYLKMILNSKSELCFGAIPSRPNEPNSVADRNIMKQFGIDIRYNWAEGMKCFL